MRCSVAEPRVAGRLVDMALFAALLFAGPWRMTPAQAPPALGAAGSFAVLSKTKVTCSSSTITGDVGVYSGAVGACTVSGGTHEGDPAAVQAYDDFLAAHAALTPAPGDTCTTLNGSLAGETLHPGVYCIDGSAKTGTLTLAGLADGVWIFKVVSDGPLVTSGFSVVTSGGSGCYNNVYWWTNTSATLTNSIFLGRVLAGTDMTVTVGSAKGQALAKGEVTLTGTSVALDACPVSEVSPAWATFPARLEKDPTSGTGFYLYFEPIDSVDGYNLYQGTVGTWYSHGGPAGDLCDLAATELVTGEMRAEIDPTAAGDHYYLVTAYAGGQEGPSGFATPHTEIDPTQSTCSPP